MVELMVVVVIIGILASVAMPKYMRSVENGKADSAVATLKMVGSANRMFAIDHGGNYVIGGNVSNSGTCSCNPPGPCTYAVADLVGCKYLPASDYNNAGSAYNIAACGLGTPNAPNGGGTCPLGLAGNNLTACAKRNGGSGIYASWGYTIDTQGTVLCYPSGTTACTTANDPPAPAQ